MMAGWIGIIKMVNLLIFIESQKKVILNIDIIGCQAYHSNTKEMAEGMR